MSANAIRRTSKAHTRVRLRDRPLDSLAQPLARQFGPLVRSLRPLRYLEPYLSFALNRCGCRDGLAVDVASG